MNPSRPTTIVFDFGGVLFQWQPLKLIQQVLPQHAPDDAAAQRIAQDVFKSFLPGADWSEFDRGAVELDELVPRLAQSSGLTLTEVETLIDAIPPHLEPQADTVEILRQLRDAGERLCYLSNMPEPYADYLCSNHEFITWFEQGVFSCDVGLVKPEAAIFNYTKRHLDLDPATTLFIDDHPANVEQAKACGWQAVQFIDAASCAQALAQLGLPVALAT